MRSKGVNDANYRVTAVEVINGKRKIVWMCPFYSKWKDVMSYSSKSGKTLYAPWNVFSNFKAWMETQDWEGKRFYSTGGNYSPDTCGFKFIIIPVSEIDFKSKTNHFLLIGKPKEGCMIGVSSYGNGKYRGGIHVAGKRIHLGTFKTKLEAHQAWQRVKIEAGKELMDRLPSGCEYGEVHRIVTQIEACLEKGEEFKNVPYIPIGIQI